MATKPITPRLHGVLDYTTGATLLAAPKLLGLTGSRAGRVLRAAGLGHIAYSLFTKYELGAVKAIPYKTHLALDAGGAAGLVAAPWLLGTRREGFRHWFALVAFGLYEAGAVALSDPQRDQQAVAPQPLVQTDDTPPAEPELSPPDPEKAVMPDGAEANDGIGARTIGDL